MSGRLWLDWQSPALREASRADRVTSAAGQLALGRTFVDGLSEADRESCRYHQANSRAIADESVRILEELGQTTTRLYTRAAAESALSSGDRPWLISLFDNPVGISGTEGYTNGQLARRTHTRVSLSAALA
jgi:hypothetical protein